MQVTDVATGRKTPPLRELWREKPVLIHLVRRFGCPLCRETAADLSTLRPELEAVGGRIVAIGCQMEGVAEFIEGKYIDGQVWVNEDASVFKALGLQRYGVFEAYGLLHPEMWEAGSRASSRGFIGDLKGDGFQRGATFLVIPDSSAPEGGVCVFDHRMGSMGDHPDVGEISKLLKLLSGQGRV
jgi:prostamide/prostaglandin F2alpha synthase